MLEKIEEIGINEITLITNNKFFVAYDQWNRDNGNRLTLINNLTDSNENRKGAVVDLAIASGLISRNDEKYFEVELEDTLVLVTDRLFDFSLKHLIHCFKEKNTSIVSRFDIGNLEAVKQKAEIFVDEDGKVLSFIEKPDKPRTTNISPPFYMYKRKDLGKLMEYIDNIKNKDFKLRDAPGNFPAWLVSKGVDLHAFEIPKNSELFDLGSYNDLENTRQAYKNYKNPKI